MPSFAVPMSFQYRSHEMVPQSSSFVWQAVPPPPHSQHPNFGHLTLLVFEAVLEVVCVSLPGYIVARQGMFDASAQKFVANLNVMLFTPCLSTLDGLLGLTFPADDITHSSLDEASISTDSRKTGRSGNHSGHIHYPDSRVVSLLRDRLEMFQIQKKAVKFHYCNGGKSSIESQLLRLTIFRSLVIPIHCPYRSLSPFLIP